MSESKSTSEFKKEIIEAGKKGVEELIKVLKEPIITNTEEDVSSDRLKNAVAAKKMAMLDALEMISRIDTEETNLKDPDNDTNSSGSFAEKFSKP